LRARPLHRLPPSRVTISRTITSAFGARRSAGLSLAVALSIFAAGFVPNVALARPGDLDRSFSHNGKVTTDFGRNERAFGVAIDSHGRILAAGSTDAGGNTTGFALARYQPDGAVDRSFA